MINNGNDVASSWGVLVVNYINDLTPILKARRGGTTVRRHGFIIRLVALNRN